MEPAKPKTFKIFVGSLPENTTVDDLKKLFAPYGPITECDVIKRCGFLHLETVENSTKAIKELHDSTFNGTKIVVEKGRPKVVRKVSPKKRPVGPIRTRDNRLRPGGPLGMRPMHMDGKMRPGMHMNGNRRDQRPGPLMQPNRGFGGMHRGPDRFDNGMREPYPDRRDGYGNRGPMHDNREMGMYPDNRGGYPDERFNPYPDNRGRGPGPFGDNRGPPMDNMRMQGGYNDRPMDNYDDRRMDGGMRGEGRGFNDNRGPDPYYQERDNRDMGPYPDNRVHDPMPMNRGVDNRGGEFGDVRDSYGENIRPGRNDGYQEGGGGGGGRGMVDERRGGRYPPDFDGIGERRPAGNDRHPLMDEPRPLLDERRVLNDPLPLMGSRRPPIDDRRGPTLDDRRPPMDDRRPFLDDRRPPMDDRRGPVGDDRQAPIMDNRRPGLMEDRRALMDDRRPLMNERGPIDDRRMPMNDNDFRGMDDRRGPMPSLFDRRSGPDNFQGMNNDARGRGGARNGFSPGVRDNGFGSRFSGGPAGGRDWMPPRRF